MTGAHEARGVQDCQNPVIPAKAGIQSNDLNPVSLDSRLRGSYGKTKLVDALFYRVTYRLLRSGVSVGICLTPFGAATFGAVKETGVLLADFGKTGAGINIDVSVSIVLVPLGAGRITSSPCIIVGNVSYVIEL